MFYELCSPYAQFFQHKHNEFTHYHFFAVLCTEERDTHCLIIFCMKRSALIIIMTVCTINNTTKHSELSIFLFIKSYSPKNYQHNIYHQINIFRLSLFWHINNFSVHPSILLTPLLFCCQIIQEKIMLEIMEYYY